MTAYDDEFLSDLNDTCRSLADRMVILIIVGVFGFCQLFLFSKYVQLTGAVGVETAVDRLYGALGGLLVIYAVLPFFWLGIEHRERNGGKWILGTSLVALVYGFGTVFYHTVMI